MGKGQVRNGDHEEQVYQFVDPKLVLFRFDWERWGVGADIPTGGGGGGVGKQEKKMQDIISTLSQT